MHLRTLTSTPIMSITSTIGISPSPSHAIRHCAQRTAAPAGTVPIAPRPALRVVSQRFLAARNLWARQQCLQIVLDMDRFADVLSTDLPGFGAALMAAFPSLGSFAAPLQRGCFIAEAVAQLAMELQRLAGAAPAAATVATLRGRANLVTISLACRQHDVALQSCAMALSVVERLVAQSAMATMARPRQRDDAGGPEPVNPCRHIGVQGHYGLNSSV